MRGLRIDIGANDIRLDFVSMNFAGAVAVMNWIQHRQQFPGPLAVALHRERLCRPQCGVRVLPAILTDPQRITPDITGILCRIVEGRRKQQSQLLVASHEKLVQRSHGAAHARRFSSTGNDCPGLGDGIDPALVV